VAVFDDLHMRLLGIGLALFSIPPTLNDLLPSFRRRPLCRVRPSTFSPHLTTQILLVGALLWWEVRGLGVPVGMGMSSVLYPAPRLATYTYTNLSVNALHHPAHLSLPSS